MEATWKGFSKPTTTPVPDELFDVWLSKLSGSELKALLYIVRRTLGFKKDDDAISLSQICTGITTRDGRTLDHGTGLARNTASKAVKKLEDLGLIHVVRARDENGENEINTYQLRFQGQDGSIGASGDFDLVPTPGQGNSKTEPGVVQKSNHPGSIIALPLVRKSNPQQTVVQETDPQQTDKHQPPPLAPIQKSTVPAREPPADAGGDKSDGGINGSTARQSQPSITLIHPPPATHAMQSLPVRAERKAAIDTLVAFGVWRSRAGPLVDRLGLTASDADRACAALRVEMRRGATIANRGAVLATRLKSGWKPPEQEPPSDPYEAWREDEPAEPVVTFAEKRLILPPMIRADGTEVDACQWFEQLRDELRLQLPRETYSTWIRSARLVGHAPATSDMPAVLTIQLHSLYARRWIKERLAPVIRRQIERMLGYQVEVRYEEAGNGTMGSADKSQAAQPGEKERNANGRASDDWTGHRVRHDQSGGSGRQTGLLRVAGSPRRVHPLPGGHRGAISGQRADPA